MYMHCFPLIHIEHFSFQPSFFEKGKLFRNSRRNDLEHDGDVTKAGSDAGWKTRLVGVLVARRGLNDTCN